MTAYRDDPARHRDIAIAPDHRRRNRLLAFAAGVAATSLFGVLGTTARAWLAPSRPPPRVDEVLTSWSEDTPHRIDGDLIPGSLVRLESPCEYRFAMESRGFRMPVRYTSCILSDPLAEAVADGEAVPVTVNGELGPSGFVASSVLARTPSCCFCNPEARKEQRRAAREARLRSPEPSARW